MKLSVISVAYNNCQGLSMTLNSMPAPGPELEYIVVDGGSQDGTAELLEAAGARVSSWVSERDHGIYEAMNKGVRMASGEYCLFLNSGDVLHDKAVLEKVLPLLDGSVDFVIGKVLFLNSGETSTVSEPLTMNRFYNGSVPHPATFIRTRLLRDNPYDETLRIVSDWKFFVQELILKSRSYKLIDDVIADFDCEGISSTNKALVDREREQVLKELLPPRVVLDYIQFKNGSGYNDTPYDKFFIKLRDFRSARLIYALDVALMKFASIFKKGLRFARNFPTKLS